MKEIMKELNSGIHDKVSLIKMLIIKCTEADSNYKKIKNCLNKSDLNGAEKLLSMMETLNASTLKDLTNEIQ